MVEKGVVIDFSAFVSPKNAVIVKEMSVAAIGSSAVQHWIFKAPTEDVAPWGGGGGDTVTSRSYGWLSRHFHGLEAHEGSTSYDSLESSLELICRHVKFVFAPSYEKAKVVEKLLGSNRVVFNLEAFGCSPVYQSMLPVPSEDERSQCLFHALYAPGFYCTQSAARQLADWCSKNSANIDMNSPSVREKSFLDWKISNPSPRQLAENGFVFFLNSVDSVKCVYCGLRLYKWNEKDDVGADHEYNSPFCSFIQYQRQGEDAQRDGKGEDVCCRIQPPEITLEHLIHKSRA